MRIEFLKQYGDQRPGDVYDHQHGGVADMLIRRGIAKLLPDEPVVEVPQMIVTQMIVETATVTVTPDSSAPTPPVETVADVQVAPKTNRRK